MSGAQAQKMPTISSSAPDAVSRFQCPTSREIVYRVMEACGYGANSWPETDDGSLARSTVKRAAKNQRLSPESQRQLLADAVAALIAPLFGSVDGSQLTDTFMTLAKRWDRLVARLNACEEYELARPWGAIPVLRLLAIRCGAVLGALSVVQNRDIEDPFDGQAFSRCLRRILETAWPGESVTAWCRRLEGVLSKDTVRRWLNANPGNLSSIEGLARRLAETQRTPDAAQLEWRFRVCCGLGNVANKLEAYFGDDGDLYYRNLRKCVLETARRARGVLLSDEWLEQEMQGLLDSLDSRPERVAQLLALPTSTPVEALRGILQRGLDSRDEGADVRQAFRHYSASAVAMMDMLPVFMTRMIDRAPTMFVVYDWVAVANETWVAYLEWQHSLLNLGWDRTATGTSMSLALLWPDDEVVAAVSERAEDWFQRHLPQKGEQNPQQLAELKRSMAHLRDAAGVLSTLVVPEIHDAETIKDSTAGMRYAKASLLADEGRIEEADELLLVNLQESPRNPYCWRAWADNAERAANRVYREEFPQLAMRFGGDTTIIHDAVRRSEFADELRDLQLRAALLVDVAASRYERCLALMPDNFDARIGLEAMEWRPLEHTYHMLLMMGAELETQHVRHQILLGSLESLEQLADEHPASGVIAHRLAYRCALLGEGKKARKYARRADHLGWEDSPQRVEEILSYWSRTRRRKADRPFDIIEDGIPMLAELMDSWGVAQ